MTKYSVPDGYWDRDDEPETNDDGRPTFELDSHTIWIDDNRDSHGYEHGLHWIFDVEGGVVNGYSRSHYLEGRSQTDYMTSPAWEDVPGFMKGMLRKELGLEPGEEIPTDLPDFYGEEGQ